MSLVQIAYQAVITRLRQWSKLDQKEQTQVMQQASSLMGASFRNALNIIERNLQKLQFYEYQHFFIILLGVQKWMLFKSNSKVRLNDCTCKSSWLRKVGEKAPFMCLHQILLQLAIYLFPHRIKIQKINCDGTAQLAEYLDIVENR